MKLPPGPTLGSAIAIVCIAVAVALTIHSAGIGPAWLVFSAAWLLFVAFRASLSVNRWRMLNWFFFSIALALLPLLLVLLLSFLTAANVSLIALAGSTELFLFAALLAAATFGEFIDGLIAFRRRVRVHPAVLASHSFVMVIQMAVLGILFFHDFNGLTVLVPANVAALAFGFIPITVALSGAFRLSLFEAKR